MTTHLKGSKNDRTKTITLAVVILIGMASAMLLLQRIDTLRPPPDPNAIDEKLYVDGKTARRMSLGFNGLVADWYWMRSLQYVGKKIIDAPPDVAIDSLSQLNLKLLAPLLDTATTLDPQFLDPYEYAAVVLPAIDVEQAIRITEKGIAANPHAWRLHQHLGYIYWQQRNYTAASETYGRGAQVPGAPPWMEAMKAKMLAEGGSRETAREIYTRIYEQSDEDQVKEMAHRRLVQLDSLDQRDALRKFVAEFQTRSGKCPASWKDLEPLFRGYRIPVDASGAPLDPTGVPYVLQADTCEIKLNPKSEVIKK
jgi:tetratricopeptide (TPR) repeat protein